MPLGCKDVRFSVGVVPQRGFIYFCKLVIWQLLLLAVLHCVVVVVACCLWIVAGEFLVYV